jgi:hypothetical protein
MKTLLYTSQTVMISLFIACNNNKNTGGHTHDTVGSHEAHDDHKHEEGALSYSLFSSDYELFVVFLVLTVGQTSTFAAHFIRLSIYSPVSEGKLTVSIIQGNKGIRHSVNTPSSPGIFRPALQPKETGSVEQAKLQTEWHKANISQHESEVKMLVAGLCYEMVALKTNYEQMKTVIGEEGISKSSLGLLKSGQISFAEYLVDANFIWEIQRNFLKMENAYFEILSKIKTFE